MKKVLGQNTLRLSLTMDIWLPPHTGASYMVITFHFIDACWQLKKLIIGFKNIFDHKDAIISKVLLECLAEWDIKRVLCIIIDNTTSKSSEIKKIQRKIQTTHIINSIVKKCLHEIGSNVSTIRSDILFVRSTTNRLKSFEFRMEIENI